MSKIQWNRTGLTVRRLPDHRSVARERKKERDGENLEGIEKRDQRMRYQFVKGRGSKCELAVVHDILMELLH